jgi:hypothetical protein
MLYSNIRTRSNTSILIGKQIVYQLALADYRVIIQFKVEHLRVCDEWAEILPDASVQTMPLRFG